MMFVTNESVTPSLIGKKKFSPESAEDGIEDYAKRAKVFCTGLKLMRKR